MTGSLNQSYFLLDAPQYKVGRKIFYDFHNEMKALKGPLIMGEDLPLPVEDDMDIKICDDGHIHDVPNKKGKDWDQGEEEEHGYGHDHGHGHGNEEEDAEDDTRSMITTKTTLSKRSKSKSSRRNQQPFKSSGHGHAH